MSAKLKFYHLTDLHLVARDSQHDIDTRKIIEAAFNQLIDDKETEIVLISGDLTSFGDVASHAAMIELLEKLKKAGKRVFVTLATHDYWFNGDYTRAELREMYAPYGWHEAYAEFTPSYSYAVKLCEGWRLLALNDDGDGREFCGYGDEELQWIKAQIEDAHKNGEEVVAMTHHPILPPNIVYPLVSHRDMLGGFETTGPFLADCGLQYLFVGHTHIQDIRYLETDKGNRMWQVNTGSLTQYPGKYRLVCETENGLDVTSVEVTKDYCMLGDRSAKDYLRMDFDFMIYDALYSMAYDANRFADFCIGMSMDRDTVYKLRHIITPVGRFINNLTFRKAGKLFGISEYIDESIADNSVKEFVISAARNIFGGSESYSPDTPEHIAISGLTTKFGPALRQLGDKFGIKDADTVLSRIIWDDGPDDQAWLLENFRSYTE